MNDLPIPWRSRDLLRDAFPAAELAGTLDPANDLAIEDAHELSDAWVARLPGPVNEVAALMPSANEARIFALSALCAISVALWKVQFFHRTHLYRPNLYLNIVGPAASGKGAARFGLRLLRAAQALFTDGPPVECADGETRKPKLVVPADMSSAGLIGQLEANGGHLLIESSELDVLSGVRGNQWGQVDPVLRSAYEHEAVGTLRKGGILGVEDPCVSVNLTGTPGQFESMFLSAENGLASRFGFHLTRRELAWDTSGTDEQGRAVHEAVARASDVVGGIHARLVEREEPVTLYLRPEDRDVFDGVFGLLVDWVKDVDASDATVSAVYRAAVIAQRYAAVYDALSTKWDGGQTRAPFSSEAIEFGLYTALHHLDNGLRLLPLLPGYRTPVEGAAKRAQRLLAALPNEFQRNEAVGVGESLGVPDRTVDKYLADLRGAGFLRRGDRAGIYVKTPKAPDTGTDNWKSPTDSTRLIAEWEASQGSEGGES